MPSFAQVTAAVDLSILRHMDAQIDFAGRPFDGDATSRTTGSTPPRPASNRAAKASKVALLQTESDMTMPRLISGRKNPTEAAMVECERLRNQLAGLRARLAEAEAEAERANRVRRELLIAERSATATEVRKADTDCLAASNSVAGWQDACRVVADQLAEAEASYQALTDEARRGEMIRACQARADRIDAVAERLNEAAERLNDARLDFIAAVTADGIAGLHHQVTYQPALLAAPVIDQAMRVAQGIVLEPRFHGDTMPSNSTVIECRRAQSGRLRDVADDLRQGSPVVDPPRPTSGALATEVRPKVERERMILSRGVSFDAQDGGIGYGFAGGADLPPAIAAAARAAGVAFDPGSKDGKLIIAALQTLPMGVVLKQNESCVWLRDNGEPEREGGKPVGPEQWLWLDVPGAGA